jgi:predicted Zn-ribbon and HTH transcriptional regulator
MSNKWKTSREQLFEMLNENDGEYSIKEIMRILEYTDMNSLINDFNFVVRKLKRNEKRVSVLPPRCLNCGYIVAQNSGELNVPSKCPNCHEERF